MSEFECPECGELNSVVLQMADKIDRLQEENKQLKKMVDTYQEENNATRRVTEKRVIDLLAENQKLREELETYQSAYRTSIIDQQGYIERLEAIRDIIKTPNLGDTGAIVQIMGVLGLDKEVLGGE